MPDGLYAKIDLTRFEADMKQLAGPAADGVARRSMRAGGQVVLAALEENCPVRVNLPSGTALDVREMQRDLQLRTARQPDGTFVARVGPGKKTAHVARWVEYGHEQSGASGRGGEKHLIGGKLEGKFVRAHPWIRPAFEMSREEAEVVIAAAEQAGIAAEAAKLGYS